MTTTGEINLLIRSTPLVEGESGDLINVTPEAAQWLYTGLRVRRLAEGEVFEDDTGRDEVAFVMLGGRCRIQTFDQSWELGERQDVFSGQPWALYLPLGTSYRLTALTPCEVALCSARASTSHPPRLIRANDVEVEIRGAGNAARQINHIVKPEFPADRLLVVEVFTPSGNWSSYPPHKHDVSNLPAEADLEEIYYYRIAPPDGFAFQRLYTADGRTDLCWAVGDGDLLLVPEGYHVFAVAHGYTGYYLNVLAGNESIRTMQPSDDPTLAWVRSTWRDDMNDGATSWRDIDARINRGAGTTGQAPGNRRKD
jgi:5-deoxy-glucuronate isomerase